MTKILDSRAARNLALGALCLSLLLRVPYAAAHMDLSRDMFVSWRLLHGQAFPVEGPILAGAFHLGPLWYYLLALLQALGRGWFGTIALLGLLASLQIPLAYLVGKELHSRSAGLLWAVGLLVPSWSSYEWMLPEHPMLSSLLVLAFALCCLRYWRCGDRRYFYAMALAFSLAVHAHPANLGCAWIGLFVVLRAPRRRVAWPDWFGAAILALLPLLPLLIADAVMGFPEARHFAAALAGSMAFGSPLHAPGLLWAVVYGGTRYLFDPMMGWGTSAAASAAAVVALGGAAAAWGLARALREPGMRGRVLFALAATFAFVLTVAVMRDPTPYYMTSGSRTLIAGLVGVGLAAWGGGARARCLRIATVAAALAASTVTTYGFAHVENHGAWPFAWLPMFDVRHEPDTPEPLMLIPAYAMAGSGEFLCGERLPSIHGSYAHQLIQNYAMDMRLACGRADVYVGGNDPGRTHWLGLSRDMFAHIGRSPMRRIGPIGLVSARVLSANPPLRQPDEAVYPALLPANAAPTLRHLQVAIRPGEHLAISNLAALLNAEPQITVKLGDKIMAPVARDRVTQVFSCAGCVAETAATLDIDVVTGDFADVDVVAF